MCHFKKENLNEEKIDVKEIKVIEETVQTIKNTFNSLFEGLSTEHRQTNFFTEHGNFINPIEVKINKGTSKENKLGFYVPFKPKLETILSLPETSVIDNENNEVLRNKNIYSNVSDGTYVKKIIDDKKEKNNLSGSLNEKVILLFAMYYDDIEVVNAIGNSRKKHKLG